MSGNKYGLPLAAPVSQTILPVVMKPGGMVMGYIPITLTAFDGDETTFTLPEGDIAIESVTLPAKVGGSQESIDRVRGAQVRQYMAATYDQTKYVTIQPWLGYAGFTDTNNTGYYHYYSMPTTGWQERLGLGIIVGSLTHGMDVYPGVPAEPQPPELLNPLAEFRWVASMSAASMALECPFFDFNWVALFEAQRTKDENNQLVALQLNVVSNPVGNVLKATMVKQYYATPQPDGSIMFDTVRIQSLIPNPQPGTYVFAFEIEANNGQKVPAELTLTLV